MSSGGFERNDEGERAATAKGPLVMRAATRERMILPVTREVAGSSPVAPANFSLLRHAGPDDLLCGKKAKSYGLRTKRKVARPVDTSVRRD